jgi:hypothetical protein
VALTEAEAFVKIDNDVTMPPGWLEALLVDAERKPHVELLGMEAGLVEDGDVRRHIGGVGLMRTHAFSMRKPVPLSLGKNGRAGFTIWQHRYNLKTSWLTPYLPVVQLDRIPEEPWASLTRDYIERGWAREWDPYLPDMEQWWRWLPRSARDTARRVRAKRRVA